MAGARLGRLLATYPAFQERPALFVPDASMEAQLAQEKIIVTGASSGIGLSIIRRLLAAGSYIYGYYFHQLPEFSHPSLEWINTNMSYTFPVQQTEATTLIHTAPLWYLPKYIAQMAHLKIRRIVAVSASDIQFVQHMDSSAHVYDLRVVEQAVAEACERHGISYTILRPTISYGVGRDWAITRIANIIKRYKHMLIYKEASGQVQPIHTDDIAKAVVSVLHNFRTRNKIYTIGGAESFSAKEMIGREFDCLRLKRKIHSVPALPAIMDVLYSLRLSRVLDGNIFRYMTEDHAVDNRAAEQDFGFVPRAFLSAGREDLFPYFDSYSKDWSLQMEHHSFISQPSAIISPVVEGEQEEALA